MATKCTFVFNGSARGGTAPFGFSETWYHAANDVNVCFMAMQNVASKRAECLGRVCTLAYFRIQLDGGRAVSFEVPWPAPFAADTGNVPADSELCKVFDVAQRRSKNFFVHFLPDDKVIDGGLVANHVVKINAFMTALQANGFMWRASKRTPEIEIQGIDANGLVTTIGAHGFVVNNQVQLLRVRDVNNRAYRGRYAVVAPLTATTFTLAHWPGAVVLRTGKVRLIDFEFLTISPLPSWRRAVRAGTRKVGRPFGLLRGRSAARR